MNCKKDKLSGTTLWFLFGSRILGSLRTGRSKASPLFIKSSIQSLSRNTSKDLFTSAIYTRQNLQMSMKKPPIDLT
ncbi:hypothetical protein NPIL_674881 [Nephila pilipes]|uniref:Uncharacterized protein n=1 Tax=Nephila pilipes TaxID=299642 RepID=A0A8X6TD24_NEPPI|nr:hypothetical protein NPIL_674881 [Nephila pilipes]